MRITDQARVAVRVAGRDSEQVGSQVQVVRTEQARGSGAKFLQKYHRRMAARYYSDDYQILSNGIYVVEEETRGGGEMNGASRLRRWEVELARKLFVSPARGGA